MADETSAPQAAAGAEASKPARKSPKPKAPVASATAKLRSAAAMAKKRLAPVDRRRSKRYRSLIGQVDNKRPHNVFEAVKLVKQLASGGKVNQTINIVMHLGIDDTQADQKIRGSVSLPSGIGKSKKVICFVNDGALAEQAKKAGALEAGGDELVAKVEGGFTDFDVAIAHPQMMGKVGKLGRVLGPQGKMPSPKNNTVTADVLTAVQEFAAGKLEYRNDKGGNIHAVLGKANFGVDALATNAMFFIEHIRRAKPPAAKGSFIKKVVVHGAMTPAVEVAIDSLMKTEEV